MGIALAASTPEPTAGPLSQRRPLMGLTSLQARSSTPAVHTPLQQPGWPPASGGVCTCAITGVPVGIGEPCFDKLEAELAKAMMSLPAVKAFEVGEGFNCCRMRGSG